MDVPILSLLICAILTIYFSLPSIKDTPFGSYILSYYWNRAFVWSGYYAIAILLLFNVLHLIASHKSLRSTVD